VFLKPKARVARDGTPVPDRTSARIRKLRRLWRRAANKGRGLAVRARGRTSGEGGIRAENVVWIFGSGRTGSTWLGSIMGEMKGQTVWREPLVGTLFGNLYYIRAAERVNRRRTHFILGRPYKETWLKTIRDLVLGGGAARFPHLVEGGYLVIKEPNGSVGAPLLMEALPESRMVLLIRDPRDIAASGMDARRGGGWLHESRNKGDGKQSSPVDEDPNDYLRGWADSFLRDVRNAKEAYDAHEGRKALVRYEDLLADTFGTTKRMYAALEIEVDEDELAWAVEEHAWENIPQKEKGQGKFYRKATPGAWREDLTPQQVEIVEGITAPLLDEFYPA
jgi:Sulfotransferase family